MQATTTKIAYQIVDCHTKTVVKEFIEGKAKQSHAKAEKMNQAYGAVRYAVKYV